MTIANPHFGVVPRHVAGALSGEAFLRGILEGTFPAAPFGECTSMMLTAIEIGEVTFTGQPAEGFYNPMGYVHGGWLATLLDSAMGSAVQSALQPGQDCTTVDMNTTFLKPVRIDSGPIFCTGKLVKMGRRIASAEGKVFNAAGDLIARGSETCLIFAMPQPDAPA